MNFRLFSFALYIYASKRADEDEDDDDFAANAGIFESEIFILLISPHGNIPPPEKQKGGSNIFTRTLHKVLEEK